MHYALYSSVPIVISNKVEAKIYSRTDIFSDPRLQRSKYSRNCARSSEQQNMLAFLIPETIVVRGDIKPRLILQYV